MKILFLCKANVGRSQMAAGLYNKLTNSNDAESSGTFVDVPNESLNDRRVRRGSTYAIDVMLEEGVDISQNRRLQLTKDMLLKPYAKLISMAESEYTPTWLAEDPRYLHWQVVDPEQGDKAATVKARDTIKSKIVELLGES